jgi:hypothetical protein
MTDLSTPTHLRALVEALPERARTRWRQHGQSLYINAVDGYPVADASVDPAPGGHDGSAIAALIPTMGPPVVLALADLLDEIAKHDQADDPHDWETCFIAVRHAADALEAAIHRTPGGTA